MSKGKESKPHIGIYGRRNAGKSSLINKLANQDIAIVSTHAGTTTDPVKKSFEITGFGPVVLIDTAGTDDTGDLGGKRIAKTLSTIKTIDLGILMITENSFGKFEEEIIEQFEKRQPGTTIAKMIRQKGYNGSDSLIRHLIASLRKQKREDYLKNKTDGTNTETVKRNHIIKTLYKPVKEIKGITKAQFRKVCEKYPKIGKLLNLVKKFKEILKTKAVGQLEGWKKAAGNLNIKGLNSFLSGLNRQLESVKNAFHFCYSNGLAEGKVNKIKNIKKIMYGKCSFELLQAKVMLLK